MDQRRSGFTIVELLIVIVVIAVLAAISIVSYSGIQQRAKYTQQVTEMDKIGKAIQLWRADTGKSLGESGSGWLGMGYGNWGSDTASNSSYSSVSLESMLRNSGHLTATINSTIIANVMFAPCTSVSDSRWVVLAFVTPAPTKTAAQQIADSGCTNSLLPIYTDATYRRNLLRVY